MKKIILFVITILAFSWSLSFAENSAIELSSAEDLQLLAEHPDGEFILTDDIYFEPDTEWIPPVFSGHLNGNGYTIYNVHNTGLCPETRTVYDGNYKEYDGAFAGLFGILDGAVVEELNLVGASIQVYDSDACVFAGVLTGLMENDAVVRNCSVQGSCDVSTSGHCFGVGGIAGYGSGQISWCSADTTLVCTDTDVEYKDEQFMGGAYAAGFIDLLENDIRIDGYDSDHGYVHNGGLVGMYIIYPKGTSYAGAVVNNHVEGRIRFFEDNRDRRAYCEPYIGEVLQWTYDWGGCTEDFERDEVFTYDETLRPCPHGNLYWTETKVEPDYNVQGYRELRCTECGYTVRMDYRAPLKQEIQLLDEEPIAEAAAEAAAEVKANQGLDPKALLGIFIGGAIILAVLILYGKGKGGKH